MTQVAGMLTNLVPYHHARWTAFALTSKASCVILELTNKDAFSVLELSQAASASYERITLFPQKALADLSPAAICQRVSVALDQQRPACVCLNGYASPQALAALTWCLHHRVPALLMSESTAWDEPRKNWKEWLKSRVVRLCSGAVVGGTPHADYMGQLGMPRNRIFPGYDAVDNDYFDQGAARARSQGSELRKKYGLPETYFLASARFTPKKNLPHLVEGYAEYRKLATTSGSGATNSPAWNLVILGDGIGRDALLELRRKHGLEQTVHLVGAKSYGDLPVYYGLASAFIHASTTEQWGLVVNEAMACGLPVLVSNRCGCAQDLVREHANGFTFDPYQVKDLAQKMLLISSSTTDLVSFGKLSHEIIGQWSPTRFAEELSRAIEIALSAPLPRPTWFDRLLLRILMHR